MLVLRVFCINGVMQGLLKSLERKGGLMQMLLRWPFLNIQEKLFTFSFGQAYAPNRCCMTVWLLVLISSEGRGVCVRVCVQEGGDKHE